MGAPEAGRGRLCRARLSHQKGLPFAGAGREVHAQLLSQFPEAGVGPRGWPEPRLLFLDQQYIPTALQGPGHILFSHRGSGEKCPPCPIPYAL